MMRIPRMSAMARALSLVLAAGAFMPLAAPVLAADTIDTIVTAYRPVISESVDASGFKHPGVGVTKEVLENLRTQVLNKQEPWNTHFNAMLTSGAASKTVQSSNQSADPTKPAVTAFNSQGVESKFIADSLRAYTQAILYYTTGDETYRANAMRLIRIWAQMNPTQYAYYNDAHIHAGIPLNRMVTAAEIMRYTSTQNPALVWTEDDTVSFTNNLIVPATEVLLHKNSYFMNQHLYPLLGAMAGYIFTGNRDRYNEAVEWFTVNRTAVDQGQNGAIKQLFRLVDKNDNTGEPVTPQVQHVEMGRDQAHGAGDVTNLAILARLLVGQGTKVDPVTGEASTAPDAVGPYEFLNDRILDGTEYFSRFMMGYDTPWTPTAAHTDAYGNPTVIYQILNNSYRGRLTQNSWEPYYYYKYVRGMDMEQRAPYLSKMYAARPGYNWDGVDGGGDYWLFIPAAAAAEGGSLLVKRDVAPYKELEYRFSAFDSNTVPMQENDVGFVRVTSTADGARLALVGDGYGTSQLAFRVRTNGVATLEAFGDTITLPDTKGQWRYISTPHGLSDLVYMTVKGAGVTVDIDHINVASATTLSAPSFNLGNANLDIYTYVGSTNALQYDFGATDAAAGDVLAYQIDNLPAGATFNSGTGAFTWAPTQAGTYSFIVSASDGTAVTTKLVTVVVAANRQEALTAASARYNPAMPYLTPTVQAYTSAYEAAAAALSSATDAEFAQKLANLNTAVTGLQMLTPLMADGSVDYRNMFASSTFGGAVRNALDGAPDSFVGYYQAINRAHTFDFGIGYKIAANAFALQVRAGFPERIGGVAMFGSNDNETWTRLTPGLTEVDDGMQAMPVQEDQKDKRYRFLKMEMIQPSSSMLELSEFRIFGTRYESVNKLVSVGMTSDQALKNRVIQGHTVKLNFVTSEAVNSVVATIQGLPATVTTTDNVNWTASLVLPANVTPGNVKFRVTYKTAQGLDAEPVFTVTDGSSLWISDQTGYLDVFNLSAIKDSSGRNTTDAYNTAALLWDSNPNTFTDYRVNGSGYGSWVMFDFKGGGTARITRAEVMARQDQTARVKGVVIQGSNDSFTWDTLTNGAGQTNDWQTLTSNNASPYRYIRVYNGNQWFGNISEVRLYGSSESVNRIASVSISSAQAVRNRIVPGNVVKVNFTAKEVINAVTATIQGQEATVTTSDNVNFSATATLPQGVEAGAVQFEVKYKTQDGRDGYPNTATTDGTMLRLVDEADVIKNLPTVATLIDSTVNRPMSTTIGQVNNLSDGNINSISDFRIGPNNSGTGSYVIFDFKAGNQVNLTSFELLARQDQLLRAKGTVIQGSNDNSTWTTLTAAANSTADWQSFPVSSPVPYRYIRLINGNNWVGNLAEIRLHGSLHGADTTAPVTADNAPQGWQNADVTVTLNPTDVGSGVSATYFKVNGGAQQSGKSVLINTEGTHSLNYWSVDWASNTETAKTVSVRVDKTAPVTTATPSQAAPANGWYTGAVTVNLSASDAASGTASTWYSLDGAAAQSGNSLTVSATGAHTLNYWSVDAAGNAEAPQSMTLNIGPVDLSSSAKMTVQGATLNRITGKYVGGVTITNTSGATLTGPLRLRLNGLTGGVTLDNAAGSTASGPYVTLSSPLGAGASVTVPLTFTNPSRVLISYTPGLYQGNL